jgi:site-specific recombinase XerD
MRSTVVGAGGPRTAAPARRSSRRPKALWPHQLRHAHAVEMAREGMPLNVIQRQLGHADLGVECTLGYVPISRSRMPPGSRSDGIQMHS